MTERTLPLYSHGLLSRWGFNDGEMPDVVMDYCDDHGIDWLPFDWRETLQKLVRAHLLPAMLQHHHTIELLDIGTNHNPIRLVRVDDRDVETETNGWVDNITITLRPDGVDVPVAEAVKALTGGLIN